MKKFLTMGLALTVFAVLISCEPVDDSSAQTEVVISFSVASDGDGSRVATDGHYLIPPCDESKIKKVWVKVSGAVDFEGELVPKFFPGLGAWQLQLPMTAPGLYSLDELLVMDEDNNVLFAAPQAGSQAAAFIDQGLSLEFEVLNGIKTIRKVKVLCFDYGRLPEFGINILTIAKCSIFKLWWFANVCDENGHREADMRGYVVLPNGQQVAGGFAHGFFYLPFIDCYDVQGEEIEIHLWVEGANIPEDGYYYWKLPAEFLALYKNRVIHLNDDCNGWNWCREKYEMEERDPATYDDSMAAPLDEG